MKAIYSKKTKTLICYLDEIKLPELIRKYENQYDVKTVIPCPCCGGTGYVDCETLPFLPTSWMKCGLSDP
jgi:hypothetical protein